MTTHTVSQVMAQPRSQELIAKLIQANGGRLVREAMIGLAPKALQLVKEGFDGYRTTEDGQKVPVNIPEETRFKQAQRFLDDLFPATQTVLHGKAPDEMSKEEIMQELEELRHTATN